MADSANVQEAINTLMECINAKKKKKEHQLNYDQVRGLAVGAFQEIRRSNSEASLIDGVYAVMRRDCPELFKEAQAQAQVPAPAPAPQAQPVTDDDSLLRRFHRMKTMSDLDEQYKKGNPNKSVADHIWESTLKDKYKKLKDELVELGGPLTKQEMAYVHSIPEAVMKVHKLKVRGLGKSCPKCGLPK